MMNDNTHQLSLITENSKLLSRGGYLTSTNLITVSQLWPCYDYKTSLPLTSRRCIRRLLQLDCHRCPNTTATGLFLNLVSLFSSPTTYHLLLYPSLPPLSATGEIQRGETARCWVRLRSLVLWSWVAEVNATLTRRRKKQKVDHVVGSNIAVHCSLLENMN